MPNAGLGGEALFLCPQPLCIRQPQDYPPSMRSTLTAYIDESGHAKDPRSRFVGMGGLVADCCSWRQLETVWRDALAAAGISGPFHMREFAHRVGQYKGWEENRRRLLFGALVNAIVDAGAVPVACVVSLDHFNAASQQLRDFYHGPYYMAFQHVTKGAALQALPTDLIAEPQTVDMVYAIQEEFGTTAAREEGIKAGSAQELFRAMKALTYVGQWMGNYGVDSPDANPSLQAADLFAYEITKEFENLVSRPDDEMRWALRQILRPLSHFPRHHLIQFYDGHEMVRIFLEATGQDADPAAQSFLTESWLLKGAIRDLLRRRIAALKT